MYIGVDQSKKSTAIVALDSDGELIDFKLITPHDIDQEFLISYQWEHIQSFINTNTENHKLKAVALEGAAFHAVGRSNDLLWGVMWYVRTRLLVEYYITVGILTAATWRSTLVPIKKQREYKIKYCGKIGLKWAVVDSLPVNVRQRFDDYLEKNKDRINISKGLKLGSNSKRYLEGLFDLADAYGIALHRLSLEPRTPKLKRRK